MSTKNVLELDSLIQKLRANPCPSWAQNLPDEIHLQSDSHTDFNRIYSYLVLKLLRTPNSTPTQLWIKSTHEVIKEALGWKDGEEHFGYDILHLPEFTEQGWYLLNYGLEAKWSKESSNWVFYTWRAVFVKDMKMVVVNHSDIGLYGFSVEEMFQWKKKYGNPPAPRVPTVNVLGKDAMGLKFMAQTINASPFLPENYAPGMESRFQKVISSCTEKEPSGRISIISGPPGTGKSRLVMALVDAIKQGADALLIPSNTVDGLTGPALATMLMERRDGYDSRPSVLIIEDADEAIRKRKGDGGDSALSGLLNLSDGIFGQILDTRIICTTNIDKSEVDPAIFRPGRLCQYLHVGPLPKEQAQKVFERLGGTETLTNKEYTLAEIYAKASPKVEGSDDDQTPEKAPIGFATRLPRPALKSGEEFRRDFEQNSPLSSPTSEEDDFCLPEDSLFPELTEEEFE